MGSLSEHPRNLDNDLLGIAKDVDSFGGCYLDNDGTLIIYVTDKADSTATINRVKSYLSMRGDVAINYSYNIAVAQYRFEDLYQWREALNTHLGDPEIVYTDIDEMHNRVRIGVSGTLGVSDVMRWVAESGIPGDAVIAETVEPIQSLATLQNKVRPLEGGLMITSTKFCTIGFVADRNGERVFVTASHCTNTPGGVEGTGFGQPDASYGIIGQELADPDYTVLPQCNGIPCRYSDSAAVFITGSSTRGAVAKTSGIGSITITGQWSVLATFDPFAGQTVSKLGMSSGRTQGTVTNTCVDVFQLDTGNLLLCQSIASASVQGGDSGGPVFAGSGSGTYISLVGIVHGGGFNMAFSPMSGIEYDLGSMIIEANP